ncbi:hypothetical protein GS601_09745 [Myxacorys almedinensis A]|uniref:Uncharacterized protein n=1 Tax=Myxacorys almedinensis A TaxID=2690445 RepID=A0A8J8CIB7_9CYAN|nr:hypothetical protein [Myxacorys almedinensis A]
MNLIKKLFSGILSFIGGLLGGKKNGGYYMEADESKSVPPSRNAEDEPVNEKVAAMANGAKTELTNKVEAAKASVSEAASSAKTSVAKSASSAKDSIQAAGSEATSAKAEPAKKDATSGNGSQPDAPANVALNMPKPTVSFATEYLTPKSTSARRRPGANMRSFIEMAKTVKPSG